MQLAKSRRAAASHSKDLSQKAEAGGVIDPTIDTHGIYLFIGVSNWETETETRSVRKINYGN